MSGTGDFGVDDTEEVQTEVEVPDWKGLGSEGGPRRERFYERGLGTYRLKIKKSRVESTEEPLRRGGV